MRALAADIARALEAPLAELGLDWNVGVRTGDTESRRARPPVAAIARGARHDAREPDLLLSRADRRRQLDGIELVVVDEWHELIGTKRGVQLQLALARLRKVCARSARRGFRPAPAPGRGSGVGGPESGQQAP